MRFNGRATTDAQALTALVAADGTSGGFIKDSQASAAGLALLGAADVAAQFTALGADPIAWTPVLTCTTPGNLAVAYSAQLGFYVKVGKFIRAYFNITTSTFTHTSGESGSVQLTGLPFAAGNDAVFKVGGNLGFQGITKASYTQFAPFVTFNTSIVTFLCSGSGQALANLAIGDLPTGGSVILRGSVDYYTA